MFLFLNITTNQTSKEQDLNFKQPVILVAAVELCSGSELSDQQLYFTGVFDDFGHIFRPALKDVLNFKSWKYLLMCSIT